MRPAAHHGQFVTTDLAKLSAAVRLRFAHGLEGRKARWTGGHAGNEYSRSRSRGVHRPGCSCNIDPLLIRGRREGRAPDAPVDPVRCGTRASRVPEHTGKDYRYSRPRRPSPRDVCRLIRALPGERPLLSPLSRQHRPAGIDARVAAPGPHDFTDRTGVSSGDGSPQRQPRPSHPAPTKRDDAHRPS